jgi:sphinganine-1-phosphate aldolase
LADWPGGIYGSPTIAGSRSGYLIACCWATLMYYGREGYVDETRKIIQIARDIAEGWSQIDGLYLLHQPDVSVVAISSDRFNIYYLFDALHAKGWHLIGLQNPTGYF